MSHSPGPSRLFPRPLWVVAVLTSCGGSLSYYEQNRKEGDDLENIETDGPQVETTDDDTGTPTVPTTTTDDTDTPPTTTTTGPDDPECRNVQECNADSRCDAVCDRDDDGEIDEALGGRDCDDRDRQINPSAVDDCDGEDNDCDGDVDGDSDNDGVDVCEDCDDADRQVHPGHNDPCDGLDSDCDSEDCAPYEQDFEAGGLPAVYVKTGDANWHVDVDWAHRGAQGGMSGPISHSQTTVMTLTVDITSAGRVEFWHKGNTEQGYDKYRFKIDGVRKGPDWSGTWPWTQESWPLTVGIHELEWSYTKDNTVNNGDDAAAIDDLVLEGGRPL